MTVNPYTILRITGGADGDVDLVDDVNYTLLERGWSPAVSRKRRPLIGGRSRYEEVGESITVDIMGSTGAVMLANKAKLATALLQAQRFADGEGVDPVLIECQPQGSAQAAPLTAVITGAGGDATLGLPSNFNDYLMIPELNGVRIPFTRRGAWLDGGETPGASSSAASPNVLSVTFASVTNNPSPVKLSLSGFTNSQPEITNGLVLATNSVDKLAILEAEDFGSGGTPTAEAGARGGNILRIDNTLSSSFTISYVLSGTEASNLNRCHIWAVLRNNSLSTTWNLLPLFAGMGESSYGLNILVDVSSQDPRTVYLGELVMNNPVTTLLVDILASDSGSGQTLDLDFFLLMRSDEQGHVLAINSAYLGYGGTEKLVIDHRLIESWPLAYTEAGSDTSNASYEGNPVIELTGDTVACLFHATRGTNWLHGSTLGLTATRRKAYLTPQ